MLHQQRCNMAFPWNRNNESNQEAVVTGRERGRARRARSEEARRQNSRQGEERRKQLLAITIGGMLIMFVFFIVAVGYCQELLAPVRFRPGQNRAASEDRCLRQTPEGAHHRYQARPASGLVALRARTHRLWRYAPVISVGNYSHTLTASARRVAR